jgi:chromatin remodeling complex protein RSC6
MINTNHQDLPVNIKKMIQSITDMETSINHHKKQCAAIDNEFHKFKKIATSFIEFSKKKLEKKPRKPSGFALPVPISNELCDFLGISNGSCISRTETTKFLIKYISDKHLTHPENKTLIAPDEKLIQLLGNNVDLTKLTRFTIQKYMNRHFSHVNASNDDKISI